jgi:menaquinone-specific isochorismate synthase
VLPRHLLGPTIPEGDPSDEDVQLVRVRTEVDPISPERFLAHAPEAARCFWQQDDRWQAGIGQAAKLVVRGRPAGPDRYDRIRSGIEAVSEALTATEDADTPRFYGGFAFHEDHEERGPWRGFPSARFVLPALELADDAQGTRLHLTLRVPADQPQDEAIAEAEEALADVVDRIGPDDPRTRTEYEPPRPENSTDRDDWRQAVESLLEQARSTRLEKAVLARTLDAPVNQEPDPTVVLGNLRQANPGTNRFLVQPGPGQAFLGAAPELVGGVSGTILTTSAVAGSVPRGSDEDEDDELARQLTASDKDREEHAIVVRSMRRRLAKLTDHVEVSREVSVLRLASIQHLERELFARLRPDQGILDAVRTLHPTPAVCGHPREEARELLRDIEPFDRGWYAAPVGWVDADGNGAFAPALRCAVLQDRTWRLFAGAGIVDGSDPDREWEETRAKFQPVLEALGVLGPPG